MITTVTLDPHIVRTLYFDKFSVGGVNQVKESGLFVCGKGINVSIALRALGLSTMCAGINFEKNGYLLDNFLEEQTIARDFALASGDICVSTRLMSLQNGKITGILSENNDIDPLVIQKYTEKLINSAYKSSVVAFCGGVPKSENGHHADLIKKSIKAIKNLDVRILVDAPAAPMREALKEKPHVVKQNLGELEKLVRRKLHSQEEIASACRKIIKRGAAAILCTMENGAFIADKDEVWYAPAIKTGANDGLEAGDVMTAGLCKAMREELSLRDMLRHAVAAAAGASSKNGIITCSKQDLDSYRQKAETKEIKGE